MYQLTENPNFVIHISTGTVIPLPPCESFGHDYQAWLDLGNVPEPAPVKSIADLKLAAIASIDADVDEITSKVIGNRSIEYVEAETQALAYQQAGYTGTVPSMVQAWVNAKAIEGITWTAQQAAEDIMGTAVAWRGAVTLIRTNRLNAKAYVRMAADEAALNVAKANWAGFVAAVRQQLGI